MYVPSSHIIVNLILMIASGSKGWSYGRAYRPYMHSSSTLHCLTTTTDNHDSSKTSPIYHTNKFHA